MAGSARASVAIRDAHVLTQDPDRPTARAVVIHDGTIEYVGSDEGASHADRGVDVRIDAKGKTLIPGFNDAHGHFFHEGTLKIRLDLHGARDLEQAYAMIRHYAKSNPDEEVLVAERWDESFWPRREFPTRTGLDEATGGRAIIARRVDGHIAVASTALLEIYDARWKGPTEGIQRDTGILIEEPALDFGDLLPARAELIDRALDIAFTEALRLGVTSVQGYERAEVWKGWQRKQRQIEHQGDLPPIKAAISTYVQHLDAMVDAGLTTGMGDAWLRFGGLKIFADGSFGGWTAYLSEPYADRPETRGKRNYDDEPLHALIVKAHRAAIQVQMHAIGDAAILQGCSVFARVHDLDPAAFRAMRHRFEHYEFATLESHDALARMGIVASMQPNFVGEWCLPEGMYGKRLGPRHALNNSFRTIIARGIPLAFGSDNMPFGPLHGIRGAVGAPYGHQRITFHEAIACYTRGSAYAEHREREKGMLRDGMFGDVVVLNKDLRHHTPDDATVVDGLEVTRTIADGRVLFTATK